MRMKRAKKEIKTKIKSAHRRKIWLAAIITALGLAAIIAGVAIWRAHRVSPDTPVFTLTASSIEPQKFTDTNVANFISSESVPDINNNRELSAVPALYVNYEWQSGSYSPALKMNLTAQELAENIKITPNIKGKWRQAGTNTLMFTPDVPWPADTKYTVKIAKKLVNTDVHPDSYSISFKTPEIVATVDSFNIYPDAATPKDMIGVAIISFNYPIDTTDFANKISLRLDGDNLKFYTKFDKFRRTAFIFSEPVSLTDQAQVMRLKLNRITAANGDAATKKITANTTIESTDNFFKIQSIKTIAAEDATGNAQQLILLDTTAAAANGTKWADYVSAYLLPQFAENEDTDNSHTWARDEITDAVLKKSKQLKLTPVDFATPNGVYQYALSYDVSEKSDRYIYVSVKPGIESRGGFVLKNGANTIMRVPYPEKTVKIAGSGALLSLAGDKKLGIMARGGADTAYVNLYKVPADEINHLISQTYSVFADNMEFKSWSFGVYDMSVVFQKKISFADPSMKKTNYASVDLGDYLDRGGTDGTGIFIIQTGWSQSQANYSDKRLILLTDLGIIRKVNLDGSSAVFVSNLSDGMPAADVEITILGRNGNAVWAGRTNSDGHADAPALSWSEYKNEKEPVAIVARRGTDVSFIPYNNAYDTHVEYSKFDIDGVYSAATVPMNAFIFSDRGIYRPGEEAVIAGIVKSKSFKPLAGVPVKLEISDARGRISREETFSLSADGMFDFKYQVSENAPIGEYYARLYSLNTKNKPQDMLGYASFRVEEFVPDNMKISATISGAAEDGWLAPENLRAEVSLNNLYGTPASNRRISAHAVLRPISFTFPEYKEYTFPSLFISGSGLAENTVQREQTFTVDLPDATTDDAGTAAFPIKFERTIPSGTYLLTLTVRGFEGDSGRNVQTSITACASDAKYLVGYKADSDLSYVRRDSAHAVKLIALDHTGATTTAADLTLRLVRRENLTSLIKDYNDYYKYQTVVRDKVVSQTGLDIPHNGTEIKLDTTRGGTYFLQIMDASEKILANIEYFVAADENSALQTDSRAEMQIRLNSAEYNAGDEITVSITAPYAGTGLITIERDKVYAYKWFRATGTTSVQTIRIPDGFEGTGYVNVSFVRDINSRDIFTTPYAFAAAPFRADIAKRKIGIKLSAPTTLATDKLTIKYETDKDARLMIFAVNSGILQVAKYQLPNPLAHFFQKSALQVETYQILSLLLPEYKVLREFAKTGGGDYGAADGELDAPLTNPFARKTTKPVAYYSGIINATANRAGTITFDIPEYFNGALKIYAVAANDSAVGAADTETRVQSPVIITAAAPLFAAPGDTFDVSAIISNLTTDSGTNAIAKINAAVSGGLKITGTASAELNIPQDSEKAWTFGISAGDMPGAADITIRAAIENEAGTELSQRATTSILSIRPATTFETTITAGLQTGDKTAVIKNFRINMYPELATRRLYLSYNAGALIKPLFEYLAHYDYPCTEQLTSRMLPYAIAPHDTILGTTFEDSAKKIADTLNTLQNRQNDDGSFDLWASGARDRNNASSADTAYLTAYVIQFLTIAKESGFAIPSGMISRGTDYLRTYAATKIDDDFDAAAHAFAIYAITRNGYITTSYIDLFEEYANQNIKNWKTKLMAAYIAASYKMLKQDEKADTLIGGYKTSTSGKFIYENQFDNNVANDAVYAYLHNNYFDATPISHSDAIMAYINGGDYSSYTSAAVILGLGGNGGKTTPIANSVQVLADDQPLSGEDISGAFVANVPAAATQIEIKCPGCNADSGVFYSIVQQGFPIKSAAASNGIEVTREYYDNNGNRINTATVGDTITVKITARSRNGQDIQNAVITDLLPGGFIAEDVQGDFDFSEIREDRVLIYTDIPTRGVTATYTATIGAAGIFQIPQIRAASMYNPQINAISAQEAKFTVSNAASK